MFGFVNYVKSFHTRNQHLAKCVKMMFGMELENILDKRHKLEIRSYNGET